MDSEVDFESYENSLEDLRQVEEKIRRLQHRRLSQRVEEILSASPDLPNRYSNRRTDVTPDREEYYQEERGTASLMVRKTGSAKRKAEEEAVNPRPPKMPSMEEKIDLILKNQEISSQVVNKRLEEIEDTNQGILENQQDQAKRLELLEEILPSMGLGAPPQFRGGASRASTSGATTIQEEERLAYIEARKSLIISPVSALEADVKKFMMGKMQMEEEAIDDIVFPTIKKLHYNKKGKISKKVSQMYVWV